jgi:hypothetical protein
MGRPIAVGTDGSVLGEELARIVYAGRHKPGFLKPHAYVERHMAGRTTVHPPGRPPAFDAADTGARFSGTCSQPASQGQKCAG